MDQVNLACDGGVSLGPAQLLLTQLISTLAKSYCDLYPSYPVDQSCTVLQKDQEFDFIVVGAGSAGSAIAAQLSEVSEWRVLLIEAGSDPPIETNIPSLFATLLGSKYDWKYRTEKSPRACKGLREQRCIWNKGKMLGGSSSLNLMYYVRGLAADYDEWERLGNPGWSYEKVLKYFKKLESARTSFSIPKAHGYIGKVHVEEFTNDTIIKRAQIEELLKKAFIELGYPFVVDMAANMKSGITNNWGTVDRGVRDNTARAYLAPIKDRKNLVILKETIVTKLLIDDAKQVYGVEVNKDGVYKKIRTSKEVILAAGAVASPQIMMISGIGPKADLEKLGISVAEDLKVGYNLQDHLTQTGLIVSINTSQESAVIPTDIFYKYLTQRSELGSSALKSMGFINTLNETNKFPDLQIIFGASTPNIKSLIKLLFHEIGYSMEMLKWLDQFHTYASPLPILLRPQSRGRIMLHSANPLDPPKIITGYLEHKEDVKTLIRGIKFIEKLLETKALEGCRLLFVPVAECDQLTRESDKYYECFVRNLASTLWHPSGTCKMGPSTDPNAVVDPRLKVYGVKGLRVGDASIMPNVVRGNTNVPTIMIGEKTADLIKEDWLEKKST